MSRFYQNYPGNRRAKFAEKQSYENSASPHSINAWGTWENPDYPKGAWAVRKGPWSFLGNRQTRLRNLLLAKPISTLLGQSARDSTEQRNLAIWTFSGRAELFKITWRLDWRDLNRQTFKLMAFASHFPLFLFAEITPTPKYILNLLTYEQTASTLRHLALDLRRTCPHSFPLISVRMTSSLPTNSWKSPSFAEIPARWYSNYHYSRRGKFKGALESGGSRTLFLVMIKDCLRIENSSPFSPKA